MYVELTILIVSLLLSTIVFVRRKYSYWSRRNVSTIEPQFPYGNFKDINRKSNADLSVEFYNQMKEKERLLGLYLFLEPMPRPMLMIANLDTIKSILIKDFNYFPNRGIYHNPRDDPVSAHLFAIEDGKWRSLRNRLSPTFTSGKMKLMFSTLKKVSDNYSQFVTETVGAGKEVELRDIVSRFTIEATGSCVLGIETNEFTDPENSIQKLAEQIIDRPNHSSLTRLLTRSFPNLCLLFRMKVFDDKVTEFFYKQLVETVNYRQRNGVKRTDFLSLLMDMKNKITMDEIAAQSFVFFGAGLETSKSNQTYCLYELALNPEYQEKARESVLNALEKHDGLTYEAVNDMEYLDQCINETLRLYPSIPILERKSAKPYRIPETQVNIPKDMKIFIPVFAIHRDERIYPDPLVFDPDRFHPEATAKRHPCAFLPFGEGPRECIGFRFGMLQSRLGLATVLSKYRVSPCSRTAIPLEYSATSLVLQPKGKLWLKLEPLGNK